MIFRFIPLLISNFFNTSPNVRRALLWGVGICVVCLLSLAETFEAVAQEPTFPEIRWAEIEQIPSPPETSSWFPDIAVDLDGRVHAVWCETDHYNAYPSRIAPSGARNIEQIFYTVRDGGEWLPPLDLHAPQVDINRNAIAIDGYNNVHLFSGWFRLDYQKVSASNALILSEWSSPRLINSHKLSYLKDAAVYRDTIHLVYDDSGAEGDDLLCSGCADTYYARSLDGGTTWFRPMLLEPTDNAGSSRAQIKVDKSGVLHVVWDEGWDRLKEIFAPERYGVYMKSTDLGESWSDPLFITYPNSQNTHLTVGSDGAGGVMLAWRTADIDDGFLYMWSTDYGESWTPPQRVIGLLPRQTVNAKFDLYDMASDSLGNIHWVVVASLEGQTEDTTPNLYHLVWNGTNWSDPTPLYQDDWYPEYPKIVIGRGNQRHATSFIREDPFEAGEPHQIWYRYGTSSVPAQIPVRLPTYTPTPTMDLPTPTPTATPTSTTTPTPTIDPNLLNQVPEQDALDSIYTTNDEIALLALSLFPSVCVVVAIIIGIRLWKRQN